MFWLGRWAANHAPIQPSLPWCGIIYLSVIAYVLLAAEFVLQPFQIFYPTPVKTEIFMRDPDLIFKHRPNASDMWDGVYVSINFQLVEFENRMNPQDRLARFSKETYTHCIDLLPVFLEWIHANNRPVGHLFVDESHLSVDGCRLTAQTVSDFLLQSNLFQNNGAH